ncbi:PREDICTED: uncharacterized protein LOC108544553 isoform X1 [Rhinopithecus bieti]|uniref:uncharacterized protein LOC108544553 isoform X1 n=1 Tax=Rhinopithecus bieti TaxID=61621 RepID=UPI00083C08E9|nr:PREDICTED: uncharacterized protein LOC108544553 isoform X1 [Rhinopithecus bieti]
MDGICCLCTASFSSPSQTLRLAHYSVQRCPGGGEGRPPEEGGVGGVGRGNQAISPPPFSTCTRTTLSDRTIDPLVHTNCVLFPREKLRQRRDPVPMPKKPKPHGGAPEDSPRQPPAHSWHQLLYWTASYMVDQKMEADWTAEPLREDSCSGKSQYQNLFKGNKPSLC